MQNLQGLAFDDSNFNFKCRNCGSEKMIQPQIIEEDQRNLALIGHWFRYNNN